VGKFVGKNFSTVCSLDCFVGASAISTTQINVKIATPSSSL
jgi:hypothetical protein